MAQPITIEPRMGAHRTAQLALEAKHVDALLERSQDPATAAALAGRLEKLGSALWHEVGLEAEPVLSALETARQEDSPLGLVVTGEEAQELPWELLYHPHPDLGFLTRHPWCGVSRRLKGNGLGAPRTPPRPLRILLFIASPEDLDPERSRLDYEGEEARLWSALDRPLSRRDIDLDVAEDGRLSTLFERLESHAYHALLLSLHGTRAAVRGKAEGEWGLLFEDEETGHSRPVAGSRFSQRLERLPSGHRPGLVVLSACRSARGGGEDLGFIPSVAERVHRAGIEAVLGMRLSVLDAAASAFSTELFRRLALGEAVGRAVTQARHEVATGRWLSGGSAQAPAPGDPLGQWSLPVFYQRTADGPLLDRGRHRDLERRPPCPVRCPATAA